MNKKKIVFIGEYLLSFPGGAERSIWNELLRYKKKGHLVSAITFDKNIRKGIIKREGIIIKNHHLKFNFTFSRLSNLYYLNKNHIFNVLNQFEEELKESQIIIQALFAPLIADYCIKKGIRYDYYLRDELQLNIFNNYEKGIKKILKYLKLLIEFPAIKRYKLMNQSALKNANKLAVNSNFVKNYLLKNFGLNSSLVYPKINHDKLNKIKIDPKKQEYITFIGAGNSIKGSDIALKIAKKMADKKFLFVGNYDKKFKRRNILFMPWQKDIEKVYAKTRVLIVPSRWNEFYGRVVVEANFLGIPAITSDRGGLLESNKNTNMIIKEIENIDEWMCKIKND